MLDSNKDLGKTTRNKQKISDNLIDLTTGHYQLERYVCEDCNVQLALYANGAIDFPMSRGPHYICPECHIVIDISMHKPPGMDDIKPIDVSPPEFVIVPDSKGVDIKAEQRTIQDPEPYEDEWLKNIGATLISKKIEARSDF